MIRVPQTAGEFFRWLGFRGDRQQAVRRPHGHSRTTGPFGEVVDCDVLTCCHCGAAWEVVVGSGRARGFCPRCHDSNKPGSGYTCGDFRCGECVPRERRLENVEAGRPALTPCPALAVVPARIEAVAVNKLIVPGG